MDNHRNERQQIVDLEFLRGLIAAVDDSGIDSLEISRGGTRIRVAKTPAAAPSVAPAPAPPGAPAAVPQPQPSAPAPDEAAAAASEPKSNLIDVPSPMVGTFYRAPAPEAPAYVDLGSRVAKGQTLCILEAMKLMNELQAEVQGVVREILVDNGDPVEYGQVLFRIEPEA
ncbi:MAG: acetyl-CoA carboxylase biotin carboxyl carrier protein [Gemmatimonadota bacterium]